MSDKRPIKSTKEMVTEIAKTRNSRLNYKEQSDGHKSEELSKAIADKAALLSTVMERGRVDLDDLTEVQLRTIDYMDACSEAGVFPSIMGLAGHGFGMSRQALHQYMEKHNNATTEYIKMVQDAMADILTNASLYNNANAVQVIFQLKNHFGHVDKLDIQAVQAEEYKMTPKQLEDKYSSVMEQ